MNTSDTPSRDGLSGQGGGCCGAAPARQPVSICCGESQRSEETAAKEVVRREYGRIGAGQQKGCGCGDIAVKVSRNAGYTDEELSAVPEGANLGIGCGNPTAIAGLQPGETVLDLGSGGGLDCFLAARKVGMAGKVIGVDMTPGMIELARGNAERAGYINVEFRLGEIEALPVADASVDVVISNCVLNLVPNKARAFHEIARVLKPGGRMFVSDKVLERPLPEWMRESAAAYAACIAGALLRPDYLRVIAAAGLTGVEVLDAQDATGFYLDPANSRLHEVVQGHPVEDILGLVTSISVTAVKPQVGRQPTRGCCACG